MKAANYIDFWTDLLLEQKAVFHNMNMLKATGGQEMLMGKCWVPEEAMDRIRVEMDACDQKNGNTNKTALVEIQIPKHLQPPTMFKTNSYTDVYQNIVQAYGAPSYKEINPAYFYVYQFPFTYAIMFGDVGHGIINALVALMMIIFSKKLSQVHNDMIEMLFEGRYLILLMSIFSCIVGLIYNDFFALAFDIFGSGYKFEI